MNLVHIIREDEFGRGRPHTGKRFQKLNFQVLLT